jgi:hypothetical protein
LLAGPSRQRAGEGDIERTLGVFHVDDEVVSISFTRARYSAAVITIHVSLMSHQRQRVLTHCHGVVFDSSCCAAPCGAGTGIVTISSVLDKRVAVLFALGGRGSCAGNKLKKVIFNQG